MVFNKINIFDDQSYFSLGTAIRVIVNLKVNQVASM